MLLVLVSLLVLLVISYFVIYNSLTRSRQDVKESWADIDVQLTRRHDLIPNLINTVKAYATHEQTIFEQITEIRSQAMNSNADDIAQKSTLENELEKNIHKLLAIGENYPELKASDNFKKLQTELTQTEDEIASARRIYNDNVANYNTKVSIFPNNIIAKLSHFEQVSFFQNQ